MRFLAVSKAFVEQEGGEAVSPKDAIRQAAKMKMIKSAECMIILASLKKTSFILPENF